MRSIANGLLIRSGQVLLARRSETRKAYPGLWSFPGGHVEQGETLVAGLQRELKEELGISNCSSRFLLSFPDPNTPGANSITYHLFAVDKWQGTPAIQDHEHSALQWLAFAQAAEFEDLALEEYKAVFLALQQSQSGGIALE
jgi:mutator protein MutT